MGRATIDRPGLIMFVAGVAFVLASTGLGLYLAVRTPDHIEQPDWHSSGYDAERAEIGRIYSFLWDVQAVMWLTFGLGAILTLVGLRMLTRPNLDIQALPPIGSIRNLFERPE